MRCDCDDEDSTELGVASESEPMTSASLCGENASHRGDRRSVQMYGVMEERTHQSIHEIPQQGTVKIQVPYCQKVE